MNYYWIIPLSAAIATLALAIVVKQRGPRTELSVVFTFLAGMLVLFNLNFFVLSFVGDINLAAALSRVLRTGTVFIPPAIVHLFVLFSRDRAKIWRRVIAADYLLAGALAIANAADVLISGLRSVPWGYGVIGTRYYNLFMLFAVVNFGATFCLLVYDYRRSTEPRIRLQLKFWIAGALVALPLGLTNAFPAYGVPAYPLGNLGNAAWAGIVAYAIVRHRLMDIDIAVTKGMAYTAVASVLVAPAFVLTLWLQKESFGQIHPDFSFVLLFLLIGVGVLFPSLRTRAEARIERSLFREKHEYRAALSAFTRTIVRILDRGKLIKDLTDTLNNTLKLERIAIALADDSRRALTVRASVGPAPTDATIPNAHEFVTSLARRQQSVLRDELEESADQVERTVVADLYRRNGWEACIPLTVGSSLIGFIALGRKRNLDTFSAGDLDLLETLGAEASVALENARLYEELKKSQEIIRRADRLSALGTLAAGIAHEVRNPLVSIQTFFQLAPTRRHDEEFFESFLPMAASEVKRISSLINELLSFARSPARSLTSVDLNETVERVVTLLEPEARKSRLTIERQLSPAAPLVRADTDQIKQVLINLVLNAIQACQQGGMVTISTQPVHHQGVLCGRIEIRDTGVGIAKDQLEHIFVPFFTTKDKGTGLGLAIAHQIVTEHGGFISVESQEGKGTHFFVDLPAEETAADTEGTSDSSDASFLPRQDPRRVAG